MPERFYLLVVRFPTGGIRTHLKYFRALAPARPDRPQPVLVCPEGKEASELVRTLGLPPQLDASKGVRSMRDMCRAVLRASRRFDARLIHSHGFTSAAVATPAAFLQRRAHLVSAHDMVTQGVVQRARQAELLGLGVALRRADVVHAVSADCAASIRLLPFMKRARNIHVIPNGINPAQFRHVAPAGIRRELGLSPDTFLVGFFGRFMAQKGFRTLIDAIGLLRTAQGPPIVVLAVGSGGFVREDRILIEERGLSGAFRFMDPVEDPAPLIAAVDCVAMPSRWEAFGLLAAEVMALGVPLLASTCPGLREVIHDTPARAFSPEDPRALAAAIAAEIAGRSTQRARQFAGEALRRFDFTHSAARLDELMQRLYDGAAVTPAADCPT